MGALPRPDLSPGPHRDLVEALHDLHHRTGWPSLRTLAREAGVSHTTVSKAFSSPSIPSWGTLELLVEAMDGDSTAFHDLWVAATTPADDGPGPTPRIAGRRAELAAVRRHLATGTGLLLVTGEAGIGKTTLVEAAAGGADTVLAVARCLPLSRHSALMPVIDLLRTLLEVDEGRLVESALARCPSYVAPTLVALLPEIDAAGSAPPADDFARQRLFAALRVVLDTVAVPRRLGIVLDDLHWADESTLALVEYLVARGTRVAIVGTWRLHDPGTPEDHTAWLTRVRRLTADGVIELGPLDRTDTAAQLALLLGAQPSAARVDAVFGRSVGHPLFTAQLAAAGSGTTLPPVLDDLLDAQLGGLGDVPWAIVRALGLAGRPLPVTVLAAVTGLGAGDVTDALRDLAGRHLLDTGNGDVALAHPLISEGVGRRVVPGEASAVHAALARHLADHAGTSAAEVAAHYRAADDPGHELPWRIRAALEAQERTATREEADHWLRALDIWPPPSAPQPTPHRAAAQLAAVHALDGAGQEPAGLALALSALDADPAADRDDRFELGLRAAGITWGQHGPDRALEVLDEVEAGYGPGMSPDRRVRCLRLRSSLLSKTGREGKALGLLDEAVGLGSEVTDRDIVLRLHATRGWHLGFTGDLAAALASFEVARTILQQATAPDSEAFLAMMQTDVLLYHARPPHELEAAACTSLQQIVELDLRSTITHMVRSNVAEAWLNAGEPARARALLVGDVQSSDEYSMWPLRLVAARVALAEGRCDEAVALTSLPHQDDLFARLSLAVPTCEALLWLGRPRDAVDLLTDLLRQTLDNDTATVAGPGFVTLARATADLQRLRPREGATEPLQGLRESADTDPLGPGLVPATRPGCTAQWAAETARVAGRDSVDHWSRAATEWDRIGRPHDAAYCRWRGAQAALRERQGTVAARLLGRAAADAREHVPLHRAIRATVAGAR